MTASAPDLVLLGNLLVDDIVLRDGRTLLGEPGGAMLYTALAARLWGTRVGLVTIAGSDYPRAALDALAARGVDLGGVRHLGRPGVRTWLLYEPVVRRVIHHLGGPSHEEVSPRADDLPDAYHGARAFHLAPMPITRQRELTEALGDRGFVSVDPHASVAADTVDPWRQVLAHAAMFFASADENRLTGADGDALAAARALAAGKLRWVAFKHGDQGGALVDLAQARVLRWRARAEQVVDTTGAGDALAGGFLAGWLDHGDPERALAQGVVSASYALADWGSRGLLAATPEMATARLRGWFGSR